MRRGQIQQKAKPFIRWAGGKRLLLKELFIRLPEKISVYYEPFLGGGSLFFALEKRIEKAFLSDANMGLINAYEMVHKRGDDLIEALRKHEINNCQDYYKEVRANCEISCHVEQAARFIYLNKTCYNGLYRENKKGMFNVPFGNKKKPNILDINALKNASLALGKSILRGGCFSLASPNRGDFVYCDPPYDGVFNNYTALGFGKKEQALLSEKASGWHERGAKVMLSNSNTSAVRELYKAEYWHVSEVVGYRSIGSRTGGGAKAKEVIVTNYY